jgi:hypothetical protein
MAVFKVFNQIIESSESPTIALPVGAQNEPPFDIFVRTANMINHGLF